MNDEEKTKEQLIQELAVLRQQNAELKAAEEELSESENRFSTRKRAEEKLAEERNLLRTLIDNLPDYIYFKDTESRYHLEELVKERTAELRTANEQVHQEITERNRVEEELIEKHNLLRTLIDNLPDHIYIKDTESRFLLVNNAVMRTMGVKSPDEIIGKTDFDFYPPELAEQYYANDRAVIESGQALLNREELNIDRETGDRIWFLTSTTPFCDSQGDLVGILGVARDITDRKRMAEELKKHRDHLEDLVEDRTAELTTANEQLRQEITERKRAEKALWESEERFALAVQGSNDGIWDWDIQHNSLYWSPRLKEFLGYTDDELDMDFETFDALLYPDDREHTGAAIEAHLKDRGLYEVEQRMRTKSGEYRWFQARGQALWDEAGNPVRMVGSTTDITERKQAEKVLKEYSERLEEMVEERTRDLRDAQEELVRKEKLAVLGILASGVGHELRNPLGVIANAVYYLKILLSDANETVREYLDIISSEVHNAEKIVSDLLDFSRIRSPEKEAINLSDLVPQVLAKHPAPEGVQIITEIATDLPAVFVDPRQIGQVLINLITNAYQSMSEEGRLIVSANMERDQVVLSIIDTGCGIPPQNLEKLFEPLFTTKAKGIGLGLSVSRNLVETNGGSIEVNSEEGRGSIFTVILPTEELGKVLKM